MLAKRDSISYRTFLQWLILAYLLIFMISGCKFSEWYENRFSNGSNNPSTSSDTADSTDTSTSSNTTDATDTSASSDSSDSTDTSTSSGTADSTATDTSTSSDTTDSTATDTSTSSDTADSTATDTGTSSGTADSTATDTGTSSDTADSTATDTSASSDTADSTDTSSFLDDLPEAGNPDGTCTVPSDAGLEDSSNPTVVVGSGTAASCTSQAFVDAVATGGVITFDCGPDPVTITLTETAKVFNDTDYPDIVIDGDHKITLSGGGARRILYMNTCDQNQNWTTSHCQNQDHPRLTVQNLTFIEGNSRGEDVDGGGGGAIFVRGGRFKIVNCRFFSNECDDTGPDVGGAAVRVLSQYNNQPVYVVNSTFGGREDLGNIGSNGGALSSIGVSFSVINSYMSYNEAIGNGANPARSGTPGGGSGGAIYNDGNSFTLNVCGSQIINNTANEGGGAIFFVSNDLTGSLIIDRSYLSNNPSGRFETDPGIFVLAGSTEYVDSVIE